MGVLPQGWSWAPAIAQTVALVVCLLALRRARGRGATTARAIPWIDNFVLAAITELDMGCLLYTSDAADE